MNTRTKAVLLVGAAWPFLGLGFMAIHFGYLPSGLDLAARSLGLFLAGAISACLFIPLHNKLDTTFERALIYTGYVLFAPIGMMTALLVPGPVELATTASIIGLFLMAPMSTVILGNLAVAFGLAITGGLAIAASALSLRVKGSKELTMAPVRVQR